MLRNFISTSIYPTATGELEDFLKYLKRKSKQNLAKDGKTGRLSGSLRWYIKKKFNRSAGRLTGGSSMPEGYFEMNDYGRYVDEGVRGALDKRRAPNSPYSFKKGKYKSVNVDAIREWCRKKGIEPRAAFPIAKSIYEKGIKRSLFFTKPMRYMYPRFLEKYTKAIGNDLVVNFRNQLAKELKQKAIKK